MAKGERSWNFFFFKNANKTFWPIAGKSLRLFFRLRFYRFVVALRGDEAIERLMTPLQRRCPMFMLQLDTWQRDLSSTCPLCFQGKAALHLCLPHPL